MSIKICLLFCFLILITPKAFCAVNYCTSGNLGGGWKFDAASGTDPDCTSNNNTATGSGVTEGVAGYFNLGVSFPNNNGDYVGVPEATSINNLSSLSMGAWINPTTTGKIGNRCSGATIIAKTDASHGPELCINSTGSISFEANWTGGGVQWNTTTTPVTTGTWQHVAVTYSYGSTSNVPTIYYNGVSQAIGSGSPFGSQGNDSGNGISIGNETSSGGVGGGFNGSIDEPFYANVVLSSTDIHNIMINGIDGSEGSTPAVIPTTISSAVIKNAVIN